LVLVYVLYWIAKFPCNTVLEFSTNSTRLGTIGWPTSFSYCSRVPPGEIPSIFRDRNLVRVDAHFRWQQFLRHIPSPLFLFCRFFLFLFCFPAGLCFLFDYDVRPDSYSGTELFLVWEMFLMESTVRADERSYQMSHRMARTRSFQLSHVAQNVQAITWPWY